MKRTALRRPTPLRAPFGGRKTKRLVCQDCAVTFTRRSDWKPRAADGGIRCDKCHWAHRVANREPLPKRGVTKVCPICDEQFYVRPSAASSVTCSVECRIIRRRLMDDVVPGFMKNIPDNSGQNNGRYKDGKRVGQNKGGTQKAATRAAVIERDGDWCLYCGKPGPGLHLHRVIYGSHGGKYEPTNCVQLCAEHHALIHSSKRMWMPRLLEYLAHANPAVAYEQGWLQRSGVAQ